MLLGRRSGCHGVVTVLLLSLLCLVVPVYSWSSFTPGGRSLVSSSYSRNYQWSMYEPQNMPNENVWRVLSQTENWISSTLDKMNQQRLQNTGDGAATGNPFVRKEVSYVCETSTDAAMIVASLFRRLKEGRQLGEDPPDDDDEQSSSTLRQTQVIVIPYQDTFQSFTVFDAMVEAVQQARRNGRDLQIAQDEHPQRHVRVSCAHLHPRWGQPTLQEQLEQMKQEEQEQEVDLHEQHFQQQRRMARQSPYPTIVLEVQASPPISTPPQEDTPAVADDSKADPQIVAQLEALFGQSAYVKEDTTTNDDDDLWNAMSRHLQELEMPTKTPLEQAQDWVAHTEVDTNAASFAFTHSDATQVDEAYEFVFTNLAMMLQQPNTDRHYVVLSEFLKTSATSLERFCEDAMDIVRALDIPDVILSTRHPEHVQPELQSPVPMIVLERSTTT